MHREITPTQNTTSNSADTLRSALSILTTNAAVDVHDEAALASAHVA